MFNHEEKTGSRGQILVVLKKGLQTVMENQMKMAMMSPSGEKSKRGVV